MSNRNDNPSDGKELALLGWATLSGVAAVALADKGFQHAQRHLLIELGGTLLKGSASSAELMEQLQEIVDAVADAEESQLPSLFHGCRTMSDEYKKMVMHSCMKMALTDNVLTPAEKERVGAIGAWLGMNRESFEAWQEEANQIIAVARARGIEFEGLDKLEQPSQPIDEDQDDEDCFQHAMEAMDKDREPDAVVALEKGAKQGDARCQALLASLYLDGSVTVSPDLAKASELFELAVEAWHPHGTCLYGAALYLGRGFAKDERRGLRLVKRAALLGDPEAQVFLAEHFGQRFFQRMKAIAWLLVAAESGHEQARSFVAESGPPPKKAQALASDLSGAIRVLNGILFNLDSDAAEKRLKEMVEEI